MRRPRLYARDVGDWVSASRVRRERHDASRHAAPLSRSLRSCWFSLEPLILFLKTLDFFLELLVLLPRLLSLPPCAA
jgi:hypothetical protein